MMWIGGTSGSYAGTDGGLPRNWDAGRGGILTGRVRSHFKSVEPMADGEGEGEG